MEDKLHKTELINTQEGEIIIAFVGINNDTFDDLCNRFHKRVGYALLKVDSIERINEEKYQPELLVLDENIELDTLPNIPIVTISKDLKKEGDNSLSISNEINPNTNQPFIEDAIEEIIYKSLSERQKKLLNIYQDKMTKLLNQIDNPNEIETTKKELLELFGQKDKTTRNHVQGTLDLVSTIAEGMTLINSPLSEQDINDLYAVALIHDIGKLTIPDQLIKNNDRLSTNELSLMRTHANANLALAISDYTSTIYSLASQHHYRFDGNGYPNHSDIKGDDIPRVSRMMTVIDCFEAMTANDRPYQSALPLEHAFNFLYNSSQPKTKENSNGGQFDPNCSLAFLVGFKNKFEQDSRFQQKWMARENLEFGSQSYLDRATQIIDNLTLAISKFENKSDTKQI